MDQVNSVLQVKWHSAVNDYQIAEDKERQLNEYIRQMENDIDDEIEHAKTSNEKELKSLNEYANRLTITVRFLSDRYFT